MLTTEIIETILRKGTAKDLQTLQRYLNTPYYTFEPRPDKPREFDEQTQFVTSDFDGVTIVVAGNGSGKSVCAAYKMVRFLFSTPPPKDMCRFFMVSENYDMVGTIWLEKVSQFLLPEHIESIELQPGTKYPRNVVLHPHANGNRWCLAFRTFQQGRKSFQAYDHVAGFWVDEQCPLDIIVELQTRCRSFRYAGSKFWTMTPIDPQPELEDLYNTVDDHPEYQFLRMNTELNTTLKDTSWLDSTPDDLKDTRRIGSFCTYSGSVFKEFAPLKHVVSDLTIPKDVKHYRVIDFGYEHETACVWSCILPDGTFYVYHEWGESELLIADKVEAIKREVDWYDDNPNYITIADPEDKQQRMEFANLGIGSTIAIKEPKNASIEMCRRFMSIACGKPKLLINKRCKQLIRQIKSYRWAKPAVSKTNPKPSPQQPIKEDDDYVDCLLYTIFTTQRHQVKPWDAVKTKKSNNIWDRFKEQR